MVDPSDAHATSAVREKLPDLQLKTVVCVEDALSRFLNEFFGKAEDAAKENNGDGHSPTVEHSDPSAESRQSDQSDQSAISEGAENPKVAADVAESSTGAAAVGDTQDKESSGQSEPAESAETREAAVEAKEKEVEEERAKAESEVRKDDDESSSEAEPDANMFARTSVEDAAEEAAHLQGAGAGSRSKTPTHTRLQAQTVPEANEQVEKAEEEAVVLLANQILGGAIKKGATHIHIIPGEREAVVNYRVGGSLVIDRKLPKTIVTSVINRYKIMAKLNVNEKSCLDGHIKVKSSSKEIVCLVSIIPTLHGEHAVVWIV
jgi:type II secretory ATPase GspE/PulE/Tfp pilus assembly ATPase PilB-like protein